MHLYKSICTFGILGGLKYHIQYLKARVARGYGSSEKIDSLCLWKKIPIFYRPGSSDILLIHSILVWEGEYDIELDTSKFEIILDLGANIGLFSILYGIKYYKKLIVAVEPEKKNYQLLKQNIESLDGNVHSINSGIWWRDANLEIVNNGMNWGFTVKESDLDENKNKKDTINGINIDTICKKFNLKGSMLVKMDIEGTEREIFEHIEEQEWINRTSYLIMEIHDKEGSDLYNLIAKVMDKKGYLRSKCGENYIFEKN